MPSAIFNSLGSNYSEEMIRLVSSFKKHPTKKQHELEQDLKERLGNHFAGDVILTYKGRDAIELVLRPLAESNVQQAILTQGLACHAIEEGIVRAGLLPIYVDLEKNSISPSVKTLEEGMKRANEVGAIVTAVFLQHTLGYANPVSDIVAFCKAHDLLLIEDLAQSFGAFDQEGLELAMSADAVICSFGRDKVLDAVSGGAVIFKKKYWDQVGANSSEWLPQLQPREYPPSSVVKKELLYPEITSMIQNTYDVGIGKLMFKLAKAFGVLTSPISTPLAYPSTLPAAYISLVLWQLDHLEDQLKHRRQIADIYIHALQHCPGVKCLALPERINTDIHLRLPLLFDDPQNLDQVIRRATSENIHITDRWYRAVVDSGSLNYVSIYQVGECPNAESVASRLLNLPTHVKILPGDAQRVSQIILEVMSNS